MTTTKRYFWRLHHAGCPSFSAEHAESRPWGSDEDPVRGYSCCESAEALVRYFSAHGSAVADNDAIVVFTGHEVGFGPDREPLVIPTAVRCWLRGRDLDAGILEHEDDPEALEALLDHLGRKDTP